MLNKIENWRFFILEKKKSFLSTMDDLESLTDNELRIRLIQYGFQNIPITETTRKTLIKKLRLYLQNAGTSLQKSKDRVTKYSSDEDSPKQQTRKKSVLNSSYSSGGISRAALNLSQNTRKSGSSTKNIYVSPVYINDDSDEEDCARTSFKTPQSTNRNSYRQDTSLSNDDFDSTSSYTKRLLQLRRDNIQKTHQARNRFAGKKNENGKFHEPKDININANFKASTVAIQRQESNTGVYAQRQSFIPTLLMVFPVIFFALIIFAYLMMSSNVENTTLFSQASFKICENTTEHPSIDCIEEQNIESSLKLLKAIAAKLRVQIQGASCGDQNNQFLCKKDCMAAFSDTLEKDFNNIKYLIDHNQSWGLSNVDVNGDTCVALSAPTSSLLCVIFQKIQTFFVIIGTLALLGLVALFARKIYLHVLAVREKKRCQVGSIIDEIFSMLMEKALEDKGNAYLSVNHMREKITDNKSLMMSAWNEALIQLEQSEKRLAFGFENINGEDVKVIRLLDNVENSSPVRNSVAANYQRSDGNLKKCWIGPAFEKCNKITPPTNCLKIRQMFDKYEVTNENLQSCIQDTILSKVQEKGCKIIDIQLDRKTCCVYVKAASCADAGIVHSEINGWWLDQRLVVVKFLKEEKYDQRFPAGNASRSGYAMSDGRDSDIDF